MAVTYWRERIGDAGDITRTPLRAIWQLRYTIHSKKMRHGRQKRHVGGTGIRADYTMTIRVEERSHGSGRVNTIYVLTSHHDREDII